MLNAKLINWGRLIVIRHLRKKEKKRKQRKVKQNSQLNGGQTCNNYDADNQIRDNNIINQILMSAHRSLSVYLCARLKAHMEISKYSDKYINFMIYIYIDVYTVVMMKRLI